MEPVRTCVGCRKPDNRANLLRVVANSTELVFDQRAKLPGRGAWVHQQCLQQAQDRGALARALRVAKTGLLLNQEQAEMMLAKNE
jgi:predicted RNA-binding protein YlxR (DUF448 family)